MVKMNLTCPEVHKKRLMSHGGQLLLAMLILAVSHPGAEAEIDRADMAEDLLAQEDTGPVINLTDLARRTLEPVVGTSITDGEFMDLEGTQRRFSEFEEQTLLLNIWATWCAPCVDEMPALQQLQDRYGDRGLTVVNLSDEPADVLRDWLSENPSTMLHGRVDRFDFLLGDAHPEGANRDLGVRPVYVIVDRVGVVRAIRVGSVKTSAPGAMLEHPGAVWVQPYLDASR